MDQALIDLTTDAGNQTLNPGKTVSVQIKFLDDVSGDVEVETADGRAFIASSRWPSCDDPPPDQLVLPLAPERAFADEAPPEQFHVGGHGHLHPDAPPARRGATGSTGSW